jgi:hypothetical protein
MPTPMLARELEAAMRTSPYEGTETANLVEP